MNQFQTTNPANGQILKTWEHATAGMIAETLERSVRAQQQWKDSKLEERARVLKNLAGSLRKKSLDLAVRMQTEMGKTLKDGQSEVEKCAGALDYFSEHLESYFPETKISEKNLNAEIRIEALGVIFAIMPWNFPLWQTVRALLPSIAVGNSLILKPSDLVPHTTQLFSELVQDCFPPDLFLTLLLDHEQAAQVIRHEQIVAVTMTGSSRGGREVARVAGENLKKVVLELGGSDAYLILEDADLARSADLCAQSRMINSGQSCICAKRFLVPKAQLEVWLTHFRNSMERLQVDMAPLASVKFKAQLQTQVEKIKLQGGKLYWKAIDNGQGEAFFSPEIWLMTGQEEFHRNEELFGPVAVVIPYTSVDEALQIANGTRFGLGGAVFSANPERAKEVGLRLECGILAINDFNKSDVRLPFGGLRSSGFGRELGPWPLLEFANIRTLTGI